MSNPIPSPSPRAGKGDDNNPLARKGGSGNNAGAGRTMDEVSHNRRAAPPSNPTPNPSPISGRGRDNNNPTPGPSPISERGVEGELEARRARERAKYETLSATDYGGTNHGRFATRLVRSLRPRFVADFGCGKNRFIQHLRRFGIEGAGIDFAMPEADVQAPMHQVPLQSGVADVVTAFDSLEHLLPEEVDEVFDEMRRVGKPGAHFVFSIATKQSHLTACGENLHPTVQPLAWWLERIARVGTVRKRMFLLRYIVGDFRTE